MRPIAEVSKVYKKTSGSGDTFLGGNTEKSKSGSGPNSCFTLIQTIERELREKNYLWGSESR
jgi:hypothetical protein